MSKKKSTAEKVGDILLFAIFLYLILSIWSFILKEFVVPIKNGDWTNLFVWLVIFVTTYFIFKVL